MMDRRLMRRLDKVILRCGRLRFWMALAAVWLVSALAGALLIGLNWRLGWYAENSALILGLLALAAAALCGRMALRSVGDHRSVARRVEAVYPELRSSLLAAVEQEPLLPKGRFGFLQQRVIGEALQHGYRHDWLRVVPTRRLLTAHVAHLAALVGLACVLVTLDRSPASQVVREDLPLQANATIVSDPGEVRIEPGNTEVERGTSLLVLARFRGPLPTDAALVYQTSGGEVTRLPMSKSLEDPVFGGRIVSIQDALSYHVEFAEKKTEAYQVTVFEYPRLVRADAKLVFPRYTSLDERLVQDVRYVSAVEGTELTLICHLNKKVAEARLVEKKEEPVELVADEGKEAIYHARIKLEKSRRFQLQLADDAGRPNQQPAEIVINVIANKPPDLKLVQPSRDVQVSPLEELELEANVWDDYGLARFGVSYVLGGATPKELVLGKALAGKKRVDMRHMVGMEDLGSEPDQLLSYHFWAEDVGPDGHLRRTSSDMYFAEVHPFDEIFRQGQAPPGGASPPRGQQQGGRNAQAAQQLAELQKQIMNATWKLIRRETGEKPTVEFLDDIRSIVQSQSSALEQANSLSQQIQDPASTNLVTDVTGHMLDTLQYLIKANDDESAEPLPSALSSEQAAYQGLLKLRSREHRVMRSNQRQGGGGSGGSSSRSQQQLQQLELTDDQNRYETQRTAQAQSQQEQADRETRQVLNRLRELARRQNDLNKRLKELQSALQEARTEEQREEVRRQLMRLREQQREVLRDTDELQARMERAENQERMADSRQQLDQARENVQRASEALEEGRVSQAAAEGTRAERQFRELQNEFRRQTSGQFDEQMREMRQAARQLHENQQELAERLEQLDHPDTQAKSLRDTDDRRQIGDDLQNQKQGLEDILNRMNQVVREAEQTEPLLAEQLHDTIRSTQQQHLDRRLESANQSLRHGFYDDAREQEREARQGIRDLREGIDRAAESVLGDEAEALRRAHEELTQLANELEEEIARNRPRGQPHAPEDAGATDRPQQARAVDYQTPREDVERPPRESATTPPGENGPPEDNRTDTRPPDNDSRGSSSPRNNRNSPGGQPRSSEAGNPNQSQQGTPSTRGDRSGSRRAAGRRLGGQRRDLAQNGFGGGGFDQFFDDRPRQFAPISGNDFLPWSDRLRDVEEMVDDPELRAEAARIRDRARGIRIDLKRHSKPPNWDLVRVQVSQPLVELRDRVFEELIRRTTNDITVPIDRDPVPPQYTDQVRRYYERLGSGK